LVLSLPDTDSSFDHFHSIDQRPIYSPPQKSGHSEYARTSTRCLKLQFFCRSSHAAGTTKLQTYIIQELINKTDTTNQQISDRSTLRHKNRRDPTVDAPPRATKISGCDYTRHQMTEKKKKKKKKENYLWDIYF
jgi:hypothetical protein